MPLGNAPQESVSAMDTVVAIGHGARSGADQERPVDRSTDRGRPPGMRRKARHAVKPAQVFTVVEGPGTSPRSAIAPWSTRAASRPAGPGYDWVDRPGSRSPWRPRRHRDLGARGRQPAVLRRLVPDRGRTCCFRRTHGAWAHAGSARRCCGCRTRARRRSSESRRSAIRSPRSRSAIPERVPPARQSDLPRIAWIDGAGQL